MLLQTMKDSLSLGLWKYPREGILILNASGSCGALDPFIFYSLYRFLPYHWLLHRASPTAKQNWESRIGMLLSIALEASQGRRHCNNLLTFACSSIHQNAAVFLWNKAANNPTVISSVLLSNTYIWTNTHKILPNLTNWSKWEWFSCPTSIPTRQQQGISSQAEKSWDKPLDCQDCWEYRVPRIVLEKVNTPEDLIATFQC